MAANPQNQVITVECPVIPTPPELSNLIGGISWLVDDHVSMDVPDQMGAATCALFSVGLLMEYWNFRIHRVQSRFAFQWIVDNYMQEDNVGALLGILNEKNICVNVDDYNYDFTGRRAQGYEGRICTNTRRFEITPHLSQHLPIEQIVERLKSGPLIIVATVSTRFRNYKTTASIEDPNEFYVKRFWHWKGSEPHAMLVVGHRTVRHWWYGEDHHFLVKNSWGPEWGARGFAWIRINDPTIMDFNSQIYAPTLVDAAA